MELMKCVKVLCVSIVLLMLFASPALAQEIGWIDQYGTSLFDGSFDVKADSTGLYATGGTEGNMGAAPVGSYDGFVRKFDAQGNDIWIRQFGAAGVNVYLNPLTVDSSGIYATGYADGALPSQTSLGGIDGIIKKYDSNGNELWTVQKSTAGDDYFNGVYAHSSGVYVAGFTDDALPAYTNAGGDDAFVIKYDSDGNEVWARQFGTSANDRCRSIYVDSSGVYVVGETKGSLPPDTNAGDYDAFVRKYDHNGNELWTTMYGTSDGESGWIISGDSSGIYTGGSTGGAFPSYTQLGDWDAYLRKIDTNGNEIWVVQFGTTQWDYINGIDTDSSGVYVSGMTAGALPDQTNAGGDDLFARKYDQDGNEIWTVQTGSSDNDVPGRNVVQDSSLYMGGGTTGAFPTQTHLGSQDALIVKFIQDTDDDGISDEIEEAVGEDGIDVSKGTVTSAELEPDGTIVLVIEEGGQEFTVELPPGAQAEPGKAIVIKSYADPLEPHMTVKNSDLGGETKTLTLPWPDPASNVVCIKDKADADSSTIQAEGLCKAANEIGIPPAGQSNSTNAKGDPTDWTVTNNGDGTVSVAGLDNTALLIWTDVDADGLNDLSVDKCLGTVQPESVPTDSLNPNNFALLWANDLFQTNTGSKNDPVIEDSNITIEDAFGCSCEQILYCKPGENGGEYKFGCSVGTMDVWTTQTGWSLDCQTDGKVVVEGEAKSASEDTDNDGILDSVDSDMDNDGIANTEDSEEESAPEDPGEEGTGNPDWWCEKHPAKC